MSTARPRVRSRRGTGPVIAITGAAAGIGRELAIRLAIRDDVGRVVALDASRGDVQGVTWRVLDVRDPGLADRFSGVDVVVHLATDTSVGSDSAARTSLNVRGTQTVLTAAAAAGVRRVVLCTSAMVTEHYRTIRYPFRKTGRSGRRPTGAWSGTFSR